MFKKFHIKFSTGLIGFLLVINILPILAPIFLSLGLEFPAKVIYFIYSFFCHQIHWRSLHIHDHQCAWCARDMAIWGGFLLMATLVKIYQIKGIKWYQILPFVIPIALDGGIQTIATAFGVSRGDPIYVSTNFMRMVTGGIFGIGLGAVIMPVAMEFENVKFKERLSIVVPWLKNKISFNQLFVIPLAFLMLFIIYLGFIQVWNITSDKYKPSNFIDSAVKLPADEDLWLQRRANAICPASINLTNQDKKSDPIALGCFF